MTNRRAQQTSNQWAQHPIQPPRTAWVRGWRTDMLWERALPLHVFPKSSWFQSKYSTIFNIIFLLMNIWVASRFLLLPCCWQNLRVICLLVKTLFWGRNCSCLQENLCVQGHRYYIQMFLTFKSVSRRLALEPALTLGMPSFFVCLGWKAHAWPQGVTLAFFLVTMFPLPCLHLH